MSLCSPPPHVANAELCSDHPPPGKYGCDEQRDFDKCWADFMVAGDFCKRTCGRCQGARNRGNRSQQTICTLVTKHNIMCGAIEPQGCSRLFSTLGCAGHCNDIQPPGKYTCAEQRKFGKCEEHYIRDWGYCASTCQRCDSAS